MSQLLQVFVWTTEDGTVPMLDRATPPTGFTNGIPYDVGFVAADSTGAITHHHQGLPFTAEGRLAIVDNAAIDHYGSGAAPISADGRLVVTAAPYDSFLAVPYRQGRVVSSAGTPPSGPPLVEANGPYIGPINTDIQLNGVVTQQEFPIATILWTFTPPAGGGSGVFADPTDPQTTFRPDTLGIYTLTLTATDTNSSSANDTAGLEATAVVAGTCYDFNSITQNQRGNITSGWTPTTVSWSVAFEAQWGVDTSIANLLSGQKEENGDTMIQVLRGSTSLYFKVGTGALVEFTNAELGGITADEWIAVTVTMGAANSQGAGFSGTAVVNGVSKDIPNRVEGLPLFYIANEDTQTQPYLGIIRDLTLTDSASVPNTYYYPMDEGTDDTFVSQPAGNNAVVTNHVEANWVECPPPAAGTCYDFNRFAAGGDGNVAQMSDPWFGQSSELFEIGVEVQFMLAPAEQFGCFLGGGINQERGYFDSLGTLTFQLPASGGGFTPIGVSRISMGNPDVGDWVQVNLLVGDLGSGVTARLTVNGFINDTTAALGNDVVFEYIAGEATDYRPFDGIIRSLLLTDYVTTANSRSYKIDEGIGATFDDDLHPGIYPATVTNYVEANWVDCPDAPIIPIYFTNGPISPWDAVVGEEQAGTRAPASDFFDGTEIPFSYSESGTTWPSWAVLDPVSGEVSGVPDQVSVTAGMTITGNDSAGSPPAVSNAFTLTVEAAASDISFIGPDIDDFAWQQGIAVAFDVSPLFSGTLGPFTFSSIGASFPPGVGIDIDGLINGTPLVDGSYPGLQVQGEDTASNTAPSNVFNSAVSYGGVIITTQPDNQQAAVGGSPTFTVAADSANGTSLSYQWQFALEGTGSWLNLSDNASVSGSQTASVTLINYNGTSQENSGWRCLVTNNVNTVTSDSATLSTAAGIAPIFSAQLQNSLIPEIAGSPTPTFLRNSVRTIVDYEGLVRTCVANESGFMGARRVENICAYSEQFDNFVWQNTASTEAQDLVAPDGSNTAWTLSSGIGGGGDTEATISQTMDYNATGAGAYTFSAFCKKTTDVTPFARLRIQNSATSDVRVWFDLNTGAMTFSGVEPIATTAESLPNGWWRFSITYELSTDLVSNVVLAPTTASGTNNVPQDGTANMGIWGAMVEQNTTVSEYVSTDVLTVAPYHGANVDGVECFNTLPDGTTLITSANSPNSPYVDADGPYGYVSESLSQNVYLWSEDLDVGIKTALSISSDASSSPSGAVTADKLVEDATNASHELQSGASVLVTAGVEISVSGYFKADGRSMLSMGMFPQMEPQADAWFDITAGSGSVGTVSSGLSGASIQSLGDDWYRCTVTAIPASTGGSRLYIKLAVQDGGSTAYQGDGVSGILGWGIQWENATFPTTYIKTEAGVESRQADLLNYPATGNIVNELGTAYAQAHTFWTQAVSQRYVIGRSGDGRYIYSSSSNDTTASARVGTQISNAFFGDPTSQGSVPMASTWSVVDNRVIAYSTAGAGSTADAAATDSGDLHIGSRSGGVGPWDGTLRNVQIFDAELDATEVGDLPNAPSPSTPVGEISFTAEGSTAGILPADETLSLTASTYTWIAFGDETVTVDGVTGMEFAEGVETVRPPTGVTHIAVRGETLAGTLGGASVVPDATYLGDTVQLAYVTASTSVALPANSGTVRIYCPTDTYFSFGDSSVTTDAATGRLFAAGTEIIGTGGATHIAMVKSVTASSAYITGEV